MTIISGLDDVEMGFKPISTSFVTGKLSVISNISILLKIGAHRYVCIPSPGLVLLRGNGVC